MGQKILRSWEELWRTARRASCTPWNDSRGTIRFRTATKQPYPIGHEIRLEAGPPVRVRFYTCTDGQFVESAYRTVFFRPPAETVTVPADFEHWDAKRQRDSITGMIETLSAPRFSKQMSPANRILLRVVAALQKQIAAQDQRIAELQRSQPVQKDPKPLDSAKSRTASIPALSPDKAPSDPTSLLLQLLMNQAKAGSREGQ